MRFKGGVKTAPKLGAREGDAHKCHLNEVVAAVVLELGRNHSSNDTLVNIIYWIAACFIDTTK